MINVNDLQSMERFIDKKIEPLNKQISMLQIELTGVKQQLNIPVISNPVKIAMLKQLEELSDYIPAGIYTRKVIEIQK